MSSLLLLLLALPATPAGAVKIERMSPPPLDLEVSLPGTSPSISGDGRFVAFVVEDVGLEVWVRDRQSGTTERVADGHSPSISGDGRFVAFTSHDDNLVPEDETHAGIFVRDRQTGKTERVSVSTNGAPADGSSPAISADGGFVAFVSPADNLVPGDTNNQPDIFVWDRQAGRTDLVTVAADGGPANGYSGSPSISVDGRFVAFWSARNNLVPGDTNGEVDVFVRDRQTGKTELVSVTATGAPANNGSFSPAISADGRFVAFRSGATDLVPGDTKDTHDVFVRDRQSGKTERVSIDFYYLGDVPVGDLPPSISADGRFVAFTGLKASGRGEHALVRDRVAATTEDLAVFNVGRTPLASYQPAISADGQWVGFVTAGQVFARNRITGAAALVSSTPSGAPANLLSSSPSISADGRFVAFWSVATDLVPGDTNEGIFVRDRQTGKTERVAHGVSPSISGDGRFVAFMSFATNLVPGDTNGQPDVFVRDRQTGKTELVSVAANGPPGNGSSSSPSISADGRFVAFMSDATNLVPGDTNGTTDVFVRDRQTGKTEFVSATDSGAPPKGYSSSPSISADGRFVAFGSDASNLVPGDTNGAGDIFVRDRLTGKTELVSVGASGAPANNWSSSPSISADGRFVAFSSRATDLVAGHTNNRRDIFVRDRQSGKTELMSVAINGAPAKGESTSPAISANGRFVVFESSADNLVPGDTNGKLDVFVAERE